MQERQNVWSQHSGVANSSLHLSRANLIFEFEEHDLVEFRGVRVGRAARQIGQS